MTSQTEIPIEVVQQWRQLRGASAQRVTAGLINDTFKMTATDGTLYVLQRIHTIFNPHVTVDIQAVSNQLKWEGMTTQTVVQCDNGKLWHELDGRVWRLLTYIAGHTVNAIATPSMAAEAGQVAARFHSALSRFSYQYRSDRYHVHDTQAHLARLEQAVATHDSHRHHALVASLAETILKISVHYHDIDRLPQRHCHGDLKISNIVFDTKDNAVCLIDLDTVGLMAWPLEMGDALRSWCNPRTEDQLRADLDLEILEAAIKGYAGTIPAWLSDDERKNLIAGLARICIELSARFLTDALHESYFGWDQKMYASRGDHNLARGQAMYLLYQDVCKKRIAAENIVDKHLLGANR